MFISDIMTFILFFLRFFFLMWTIFKVFIEFVTILLPFYVLVYWFMVMVIGIMLWFIGLFIWFMLCGILAPRPGVESAPSALEGEVLTTGPPGKSQTVHLNGFYCM